jgi:hypothetical protein
MNRRSVLAAAGTAFVGLGGCLGSDEPSESTPPAAEPTTTRQRTPTRTPTPERTTEPPDVPLDVSVKAHQRGAIRIHSVDATAVSGSAVDQYLFLHTERPASVPPEEAPALTEFALRFDGKRTRRGVPSGRPIWNGRRGSCPTATATASWCSFSRARATPVTPR